MQRVAIARALVNDPDIILADEPTGALDTETSVQIMELLKNIAKDKLVIMVTHNPELAEKSGYSIETVKAYMSGARKPSKKMDEFFKAALKEKLQSGNDTLKFVKDALSD